MKTNMQYRYENIPIDTKTFQNVAHSRILWVVSFVLLIALFILIYPFTNDTYYWYKQLDSNVIRFFCMICVLIIFLLAYNLVSSIYKHQKSEAIDADDVNKVTLRSIPNVDCIATVAENTPFTDKLTKIFLDTADYCAALFLMVCLILTLHSHQYSDSAWQFCILIFIPICLFLIVLNPNNNIKRLYVPEEKIDCYSELKANLLIGVELIFIFISLIWAYKMFSKICFPIFCISILLLLWNLFLKWRRCFASWRTNSDISFLYFIQMRHAQENYFSYLPAIIVGSILLIVVKFWWQNDPATKSLRSADVIVTRFNTFEEASFNISTSGFNSNVIKTRTDKVIEDKLNRILAIHNFGSEVGNNIKIARTNKIIVNKNNILHNHSVPDNIISSVFNEQNSAIIWGFSINAHTSTAIVYPICTYFSLFEKMINKQYRSLAKQFFKDNTELANSIPIIMENEEENKLDSWLLCIMLISYYHKCDDDYKKGIVEEELIEKLNEYNQDLDSTTAFLSAARSNDLSNYDKISFSGTNAFEFYKFNNLASKIYDYKRLSDFINVCMLSLFSKCENYSIYDYEKEYVKTEDYEYKFLEAYFAFDIIIKKMNKPIDRSEHIQELQTVIKKIEQFCSDFSREGAEGLFPKLLLNYCKIVRASIFPLNYSADELFDDISQFFEENKHYLTRCAKLI